MDWTITLGILVVLIALTVILWYKQGDIATMRPINEWTFTHMNVLLPITTVPKSDTTKGLVETGELPSFEYGFAGEKRTLADLHKRTHTTSFIVVHKGRVLAEEYPGRFAAPGVRFQAYSVTKSITSILIGIAIDRGVIDSVSDLVTKYSSRVRGTAFEARTIEHLLNMSSGVGELEDWTIKDAAINRLETAVVTGGSVVEITRSLPEVSAPDLAFNYSTFDTDVLGWVLEEATGMALADICAEWLWKPLGAENDAYYFLTRGKPQEALAGASFNASTRDLARVGMMMANGGKVGKGAETVQVVSESWVKRSHGANKAHLEVGELGPSGYPHYGYSNQWWTLGAPSEAFTGLGVHGQYLWVDPAKELVIVKTSAWNSPDDELRDLETVTAFKALAEVL